MSLHDFHGRTGVGPSVNADVDLDIVTGDGVDVMPGREAGALFGPRAAIVVAWADCADVVLGSLEEVSIRWHPLAATSPNICASVRVVYGQLTAAEIIAAGEANLAQPDEQRLLDSLVRDAIGAWKMLSRGHRWEAAAGVERMRRSLLMLRGRRDSLRPGPAGRCARRSDRRGSSMRRFRAPALGAARADRRAAALAAAAALIARQLPGTHSTSPAGMAASGEVVPANTPLM